MYYLVTLPTTIRKRNPPSVPKKFKNKGCLLGELKNTLLTTHSLTKTKTRKRKFLWKKSKQKKETKITKQNKEETK